ncbi:uncharacterized protein TRIADDRAFT_60881 [Trichoplax adhaerens]|uniref:G-protein coupled receptors family 1 profile domain-containing protein n=1 Tax=Trichoplax adhaerens TaxID=10228 RepID=B3S9E9_TRIAD|nr:predicted protein [Trichoplax adhaerens]EDV20639.1 predicted protein [Trichoplax adhaerens]|eukprot:XP_002116839.1 predicted protein [Trichoplax adhaerens]
MSHNFTEWSLFGQIHQLLSYTDLFLPDSKQLDIIIAVLTPMIIMDMIVCLLGILINIFIIKIALRDQSNLNAIQCLLVNLSLSYTVCIILVLLQKLTVEIIINVQVDNIDPNLVLYLCKAVMIIQLAIYNTAMITLSVICIEQLRQISLTFGRKLTRSFTLSYVVPSTWFIGIAIALPLMKYVNPTVPEELFLCEIQYNVDLIGSLIYIIFLVIMIYLLPGTLVVVCYGKIAYKMKQSDWGRSSGKRLARPRVRFSSSQLPQQQQHGPQQAQPSQQSQQMHQLPLPRRLPKLPSRRRNESLPQLQQPLTSQPSQQLNQCLQQPLESLQQPSLQKSQQDQQSQQPSQSQTQQEELQLQPVKLQRKRICIRNRNSPLYQLTPRQKQRLEILRRRKTKIIRMLYILIALYLLFTTIWIIVTLLSIFIIPRHDDSYHHLSYLVPILLESGDLFFLSSCISIPFLNIIYNDKLRQALPTCWRSHRHWSISNNVITVRPDHLK